MLSGAKLSDGSEEKSRLMASWDGGDPRLEVHEQIDTLVKAGLLERSSMDTLRFVTKYTEMVIYFMIRQERREDMHKVWTEDT